MRKMVALAALAAALLAVPASSVAADGTIHQDAWGDPGGGGGGCIVSSCGYYWVYPPGEYRLMCYTWEIPQPC